MEYWKDFEWQAFLANTLTTIAIIIGAVVIWAVLSRSIRALERSSRVSSTMVLPLRLVVRWGVFIVAMLMVMSSYGIPIGNFWTFVSTVVGLIAIGFVAVWSVLSNVSSTFLLLLIQPFRVGDYVRIVGEDVMGRVIDINFMFTTVRKDSGDVFKVPNNQFFQKSILKPADPKKLEESEEDDSSDDKSEASPHKDQNLEGIQLQPEPQKMGR